MLHVRKPFKNYVESKGGGGYQNINNTVKPRFWNTSWSAANGIPESSIFQNRGNSNRYKTKMNSTVGNTYLFGIFKLTKTRLFEASIASIA